MNACACAECLMRKIVRKLDETLAEIKRFEVENIGVGGVEPETFERALILSSAITQELEEWAVERVDAGLAIDRRLGRSEPLNGYTHRDWDDFIFGIREWDRDLGMSQKKYEADKRRWIPQEFHAGSDEELLSFPIHGGTGWLNKRFSDIDGDDKGFRTTKGVRRPIFIPRTVWDERKDASKPVFVTEGPCKALALLQAGKLAIAFAGTYASERVPGRPTKRQFYECVRKFNWHGRTVFLNFYADQYHKSGVRRSIIQCWLLLHSAGADVRQLTNWDIARGKGIDDYLVTLSARITEGR